MTLDLDVVRGRCQEIEQALHRFEGDLNDLRWVSESVAALV